MEKEYKHLVIEKEIQQRWEQRGTYFCPILDFTRPKYYIMDMFPYPSANGLHVGHPRGYTATDVIARYKRLKGFNVLHPIGFDAFGLPAEQYAIANNIHPRTAIDFSIEKFTKQLKSIGFSYDWSKQINTTDEHYYKWTQWIFSRLFEKGLAYEAMLPVNWCPELGTVLANEEVIDGRSERGNFPVIRKNIRQWVLKITDYAERLLDDLSLLDWPASTIAMQRNWIGKSVGADIDFTLEDGQKVTVFTTRIDTLYGCSYVVLAPEHPLVDKIAKIDKKLLDEYRFAASSKSDLERETEKDKSGLFLKAYAINPINDKKIPIYIADYVLASYGQGAVMAVPAHDERDYQFAKKHNLPIIPVIEGDISEQAFEADGIHINSGVANGLGNEKAAEVILKQLELKGCARSRVNYKLRDWIFSRQRYWGEPIPIIHFPDGEKILETNLPLTLPGLDDFKPTTTGEPPLSKAIDWINVEVNGRRGKRETNTMPQWAGSCWYYLRYLDPKNANEIADKKILDHWLPVDFYIGGTEHSVLHLLYARFWHKVLYDIGLVSTPEPFIKLYHQGMILGENGEKMSKSRGNVINPDEIINEVGADTLRLYELFLGPLDSSLPWSTQSMQGCRRFLERIYRLCADEDYARRFIDGKSDSVARHVCVQKVSQDIEDLHFNTAISQLMIFVNELYKQEAIHRHDIADLLIMLHPFAPHIATYLYQEVFGKDIENVSWPDYKEELCIAAMKHLPVQINGKVRGFIDVPAEADQEYVLAEIKKSNLNRFIDDVKIVKVIYVSGKIINIIINN